MKIFRSQMPRIFCLFLIAFTTSVFADGPLWTHKPAQDIKWYEMTDVGTVLVGTAGNLYALDPENGNALWTRNDLSGVKETEVHQIENTPLLIGDPKG